VLQAFDHAPDSCHQFPAEWGATLRSLTLVSHEASVSCSSAERLSAHDWNLLATLSIVA